MADDLKPVYLLTGSDTPKIDRALRKLRSRFDASAFEQLSALDPAVKGADIVAACNSMGLFGGDVRLVLVTEIDGRLNAEGRLTGGLKNPDIEEIIAYLASPAPGTVLALVGLEVKADSPLGKAVKKRGDILAWQASKKDLPRWLREQFSARGVPIDIEACRRVLELVGDNRTDLASEVDRLATWSAGEPVTEDFVHRHVYPRAEPEPFALTEAFGARDVGAALAAAEAMIEDAAEGDEESSRREKEIHKIVGQLANHIRRLREVQALEAQGVRPDEAATKLKRHPFYVKKLYGQASEHSPEELLDAMQELARLDHALKGGSREPGELSLSRLLIATVGRREPAGRRAS